MQLLVLLRLDHSTITQPPILTIIPHGCRPQALNVEKAIQKSEQLAPPQRPSHGLRVTNLPLAVALHEVKNTSPNRPHSHASQHAGVPSTRRRSRATRMSNHNHRPKNGALSSISCHLTEASKQASHPHLQAQKVTKRLCSARRALAVLHAASIMLSGTTHEDVGRRSK